ncbi:MAG TPA: hypothetical protein ENJ18_15905, partial [Nannocystis exedens]|nr:hypothetical protein [Nannocystis exedens]
MSKLGAPKIPWGQGNFRKNMSDPRCTRRLLLKGGLSSACCVSAGAGFGTLLPSCTRPTPQGQAIVTPETPMILDTQQTFSWFSVDESTIRTVMAE